MQKGFTVISAIFILLINVLYGQENLPVTENVYYLSDSNEVFMFDSYHGIDKVFDTACFILIDDLYCKDAIIYEDRTQDYLMMSVVARQDTSVWTEFWKNGKVKSIRKFNKDYDCQSFDRCEESLFCENGNLVMSLKKLEKDEVERISTFFCDGQRRWCCDYNHAKQQMVGITLEWWQNGNLRRVGQFSTEGKRIGKWYFLNERGRIWMEVVFDNPSGKLLKERRLWWRRGDREVSL